MIHFTKKQEKSIVNQYKNGISTCKLEEQFNCTDGVIARILDKHSISRRSKREINKKYHVKSEYFEKIDSHEKAYILGLLMTDGYNRESHGYVHFGAQEADRHIVGYINDCLHTNSRAIYRKKVKNNEKPFYYTFITDKKVSEDLGKLGCVQRKSLICRISNKIPERFMNSFILGCFDGDGCFYRSFNICSGSEGFCLDLKFKIKSSLDIDCHIYETKNKKNSLFTLVIYKKLDIQKIFKWIYANQKVFLIRKKIKIEKFLQIRNLI